MSEPSTPYVPRCIHLCCKSMMVYGEDFQSDPEFQAGFAEFWCVQTSKSHGPDNGSASLESCTNPERSCYQQF